MTFLKKIGIALLKGTQLLVGLGPLIPGYNSTLVGKIVDTLERISAIIVNVEAFGAVLGTPGVDKLRAATPLVTQIILQSDLMIGKKIDNPILFASGCTKVTDGMAEIMNSIKNNVDTIDVS
jgi:hypothetical protein